MTSTSRTDTTEGERGRPIAQVKPLADTNPVDLNMTSTRALRTTIATDQGPLAVYVAHLGPHG